MRLKIRLSDVGLKWQRKLLKLGVRTQKQLEFYQNFEYEYRSLNLFEAIDQASLLLPGSVKIETPERLPLDHWRFEKIND